MGEQKENTKDLTIIFPDKATGRESNFLQCRKHLHKDLTIKSIKKQIWLESFLAWSP